MERQRVYDLTYIRYLGKKKNKEEELIVLGRRNDGYLGLGGEVMRSYDLTGLEF